MITTRTAKFLIRRRRSQQLSTLRHQPSDGRNDTAQNGRHINNNKLLEAAFVTPRASGSFGGVKSLKRYTGESYGKIKRFLAGQEAHTIHKPLRRKFPRRKTYSKGINDLYQADLIDLTNIARYNDKHRFVLTVIDVFSKRAWAVPVLNKSAQRITDAFEKVLSLSGICRMLQTDRGSEFINSTFQEMLKRNNIHFYTSNSDTKASICERFNRTLKTKLFKYFTYKKTWRYIDILPDILESYNNTYHRSIKMAPNEVNEITEDVVRDHLYPLKSTTKPRFRFELGDTVRIPRAKSPFAKAYEGNWTKELFRVDARHPTEPVTYSLKDLNDESIKGRFYESELNRVSHTPKDYFDIEKILRTKRDADGRVRYFVRWLGYGPQFDSWTDELKPA